MTKTKEISVLRMFLQDEDDSGLAEVESKSDLAKLSSAKIDVVERLVRDLEAQLSDAPEASELRVQLARLSAAIEEQGNSISGLVESRRAISSELRARQQALANLETEWGDTTSLQARFQILRQRYDSDIARLDTLREAGNLLGFFTAGVCAFCGASPEHQHNNTECEGDTTSFGSAIDEQRRRTRALADDLRSTMNDLAMRRRELRRTARVNVDESKQLTSRLAESDRVLTADNGILKDLIQKRTSFERSLGLYDQIETLEKMKQVVADEATAETAAVAASINLRAQREFSQELVERLGAWGFPNAADVRYDAIAQDIVAGDQLRSAHGKGVRAILHAAFTLGLAKYCTDREIRHPGFVVLDSPLVTYRPPDQASADDSHPPANVVTAFYRDVQRHSTGQVVVLENTDPTESLDDQTVDVVFTASDHGRYGFFPTH